MTPYWVKKKDKQFHYYQCTKYSQYKKLKCKIKNINADKLEAYTVERLAEVAGDKKMFHSLVDQVNLDLEGQKAPQKKELAEVNQRIDELKGQLERYLDLVGEKGREVVTALFMKRLEKLQYQLKGLEKKKGELTLMRASAPFEINAKYIIEAIKDFSGVYDELSNQDKAIYLGLIIQDVTVFDNRISIRIHTLPENPSELTGSKNRLAWLRDQDSNLG